MDHESRGRWLDAREQLRSQRVERWERQHKSSAGEEPQPQRRLEAVADVIARVSRSSEATETLRGEETNA
jgi:hypothetical protein